MIYISHKTITFPTKMKRYRLVITEGQRGEKNRNSNLQHFPPVRMILPATGKNHKVTFIITTRGIIMLGGASFRNTKPAAGLVRLLLLVLIIPKREFTPTMARTTTKRMNMPQLRIQTITTTTTTTMPIMETK